MLFGSGEVQEWAKVDREDAMSSNTDEIVTIVMN
jgi:hypothetical protein